MTQDMKRIPYSRQWVDDADVRAVVETLTSDFLTQGPAVPRFEEMVARMHGVAHAVAVSSATGALHIACLALGLGPGDWLWTSPISFVASANCGLYCGAQVDFVDIDPATRNMSVEALTAKLAQAEQIGRLPKVVVPVDFAGFPCDLEPMRALAERYGFAIVSDSSHAVGARYLGQPVGARFADITVFSFHPVKIITTAEGGMCLTQDPALANRLRLLRSHGITRDPAEMVGEMHGPWYYEQVALGLNYRLTDLQAALGSSQLERIEGLRRARDVRASRYDAELADLPLIVPARRNDRMSAHHLYVVEINGTRTDVERASLYADLISAGIGANVHYIPIHLQPYYRALGFREGDFPNAEAYYRRALTIPLYPAMTDEEQDRVVACLRSAVP